MSSQLLISAREAAFRLNISVRHLWNLVHLRKAIPAVRLGRRLLFRPQDLEEFVQRIAQTQGAEAAQA